MSDETLLSEKKEWMMPILVEQLIDSDTTNGPGLDGDLSGRSGS